MLRQCMRIALPQWEQRISPILDDAGMLVLIDTSAGGLDRPSAVPLSGAVPLERARFLQWLGVDYVLCGAVSRELKLLLDAAGVEVIANNCGPIEEVVRAFLAGRTSNKRTGNRRSSSPAVVSTIERRN